FLRSWFSETTSCISFLSASNSPGAACCACTPELERIHATDAVSRVHLSRRSFIRMAPERVDATTSGSRPPGATEPALPENGQSDGIGTTHNYRWTLIEIRTKKIREAHFLTMASAGDFSRNCAGLST